MVVAALPVTFSLVEVDNRGILDFLRDSLCTPAICTLYLNSSLATNAVLLICLSAGRLFVSVHTFHAPNVKSVYPEVYVIPLIHIFRPLIK